MKRLTCLLFSVLILLFSVSTSAQAAAGSITGTATVIKMEAGYPSVVKVALVCTAGVGGGEDALFPSETVQANITGVDILGLKLYCVGAYPGGTAPTDATDLTLTSGFDLLDGKGTNAIDSTTTTLTWAGSSSVDFPVPVVGDITVGITNNAVAGAITNLILIFGK